jgi:hypothetical protein
VALFRSLERVRPGLLRRPLGFRQDTAPAGAIGEFWRWWADARLDVAAALQDGATIALDKLVGPQVEALHPGLTWETTPGEAARHRFVLTGGGDPALRVLTERWHRSGPAADTLWEYAPARQADLGRHRCTATIAGCRLDLPSTLVGAQVDDTRCRLDVSVFHPAFAQMPEAGRRAAASRVLEWALGEDDVVRWVGDVRASAYAPLEEVPVVGLDAVVRQLRARWGQRWIELSGTSARGARVDAAVRHPVHRSDYPLFDEHVAVRLPFADQTFDGLPAELAARELAAFEVHLTQRLGTGAVLVGHETSCGQRVLHLYGDSEHSVRAQITPLVSAWVAGVAHVHTQPDPTWRATAHLRP